MGEPIWQGAQGGGVELDGGGECARNAWLRWSGVGCRRVASWSWLWRAGRDGVGRDHRRASGGRHGLDRERDGGGRREKGEEAMDYARRRRRDE